MDLQRDGGSQFPIGLLGASTKHIALLEEKIQLGTLPAGGDGVKSVTKRVEGGVQ